MFVRVSLIELVALGLSIQLLDMEIPHAKHDVRPDYLITPEGILSCKDNIP